MVKGRQGERVRLCTKGKVLGYKRSKSNQYPNTSLVQIEGVNTKEEVDWYLGKYMDYVYKAKFLNVSEYYVAVFSLNDYFPTTSRSDTKITENTENTENTESTENTEIRTKIQTDFSK
uniref:Ribosomal protein L33 n=1 Tax=Solanum tuberosum TaxID=4113 RepID=M1BJ87_SOLTU